MVKQRLIIVIMICVMLVFGSCTSPKMLKYYSQKENYISVTGKVASVEYNDDFKALYICFSELSTNLDDVCFKIVGKNLEIVRSKQIEDKVRIGGQITFETAPRYFGDGYVMPIVSVSVNGEILLGFEEGYNNFIEWLSK